jgi:hypothetical protein
MQATVIPTLIATCLSALVALPQTASAEVTPAIKAYCADLIQKSETRWNNLVTFSPSFLKSEIGQSLAKNPTDFTSSVRNELQVLSVSEEELRDLHVEISEVKVRKGLNRWINRAPPPKLNVRMSISGVEISFSEPFLPGDDPARILSSLVTDIVGHRSLLQNDFEFRREIAFLAINLSLLAHQKLAADGISLEAIDLAKRLKSALDPHVAIGERLTVYIEAKIRVLSWLKALTPTQQTFRASMARNRIEDLFKKEGISISAFLGADSLFAPGDSADDNKIILDALMDQATDISLDRVPNLDWPLEGWFQSHIDTLRSLVLFEVIGNTRADLPFTNSFLKKSGAIR